MKIDRYEMGAVTILRIEGDIDETGMDPLRQSLIDCIQDKRYNIVINLEAVKFISYMGLGVLVEGLRRMRVHGGDLKLSGVNLYTERLFRMVGVTHVFAVHKCEEQAVQSYRKAA